jgi:drug/metabolite transporter (DMT)-like permease
MARIIVADHAYARGATVIVALVVLSAFLHALWNALLRLERDKDRTLMVAVVVATLFAAVVAGVRWELGAVPFASLTGVGFTVLAGTMEASYFATLAKAMGLGRLGVVYTISRGGAVLAVWPLSIALFGEAATAAALAGSAVVVGGLALSGLGGSRGGSRGDDRGESAGRRAAVGWSVACAMSIAGYHLAYEAALREAVNPSACFALSLGVSAAINGVRLRGAGRGGAGFGALVRQRWPRLVMMGLLCGGSFLILMEALARGGPGYVLTLRNTSVLFAMAMAWRIGERPRRAEVAGAALVAVGAALLAP